MKRYFIYELKKSLLPIGLLTVIFSLIYIVSILTAYEPGRYPETLCLSVTALTGGILACCVPVWVFSYKMQKRSVDLFFSLPLSHTKILAVKFLLGMIAVYVPYTVTYWIGAFTVMAKAYKLINAYNYAVYFIVTIIPIYIIYALSAFVFTRANRLEDGIVFIAFWAFALTVIAFAVQELLTYKPVDIRIIPTDFIPAAPLGVATVVFRNNIIKDYQPYLFSHSETVNMIIGFTLNALLAAGASVGIFVTEKYSKAENVSQISESPFGYKCMIPLFTVCLSPFMWEEVITGVLLCIFSFLVTVIYKRTIKIGKQQAIIYAVSLVVGFILHLISIT